MNKLKPEDKAIILSILFGVGFWIIDILLDNQLFYSSESIPSEVLNQIYAHEIYIRSFVLSLFLIFGLILARVLKSRRSLLENAERSKEELHTMLYSIGDAVIATDNRAAITHMNPQAEKITGWDLYDARGLPLKKIFNIINEKTRQPIESPADIVLREGRRVNLANHTVLIAKNGREVSIADSGSPIFDNEKKIIGVVLVFRDVTEERRRRNLIFDREARYRGIISHTTDGIFLSDQEGKILEWNRGNEEITGLSRNDVIGKHFCEIFIKFVPPEKRTPEYQREIQERFSKIRKDVQNGLREYTTEVELHMPDGSIKYIEQSIFLIPRKGGNWFGNISTDITRAKLREKEIRQSEEKFSKTFALSPDAIVISRLSDGMIIECNQGFIAEYGAPREVIIGRTSKEIRLWKNPADREKYIHKLMDKGFVHDFVTEILSHKNELIYASLSGTIVDFNNEKCVVTYSRNVTDRINYEQELAAAKEDLEFKVEERTAEISWMNEELRREIVERAKYQQALQRSEENYRSLIEQIPIGVYRTTLDGRFIHANPALADILGCGSVEDLYDMSVYDFYFSGTAREEQIRRQRESSGVVTTELKLRRRDNRIIWVMDIGQINFSPEGDQIMDGTIQDITKQKTMHFALEESERRYRSLFENLMDIYFQIDPDGVLINISPSAEIITGYPTSEMVGHNLLDFIADPQSRDEFLGLIHEKSTITGYVFPVISAFGNRIYLSTNAHFSTDEKGNPTAIEGIARDITTEIQSRNHIFVLYEISRAINSTESLDELYSSIHKSLSKIIDTDNFFIALYDKHERLISFPYFVDLYDTDVEPINVNLEESLTARVIRTGEPILAYPEDLRDYHDEKIQSIGKPALIWLGVPLKIMDEVIGAIAVQSYSDIDLYDHEDIGLLQSVSDQIAVAIDRKQSELALNFQLEFMQNLIDTIPNPVFFKGYDRRYQGCNKAFEDFTGYDRSEIIGRTVYDIFPESLAKDYDRSDRELLDHSHTTQFESKIINSDKQSRDAIFYKSCYFDSHDNIAGVVGMFIDITDRKIAERQLKEAREQAELIYRVTPSCIYTVNNENVITSWNKRIAELTGYSAGEVTGREAGFLIPVSSSQCPFTDRRIEKPLYAYEQNIVTRDGSLRVVSKNVDYLRNAQGEIVGGIISFEDISERKRIQNELSWQANLNLAIADLSKAIISLESIGRISEMILDHLASATDSTFGFVGQIDNETGHVIATAYSENAFPDELLGEDGARLTHKNPLYALVIDRRRPVLSNSVEDELCDVEHIQCRTNLEKVVLAPAITGNRLLGMIAIANPPRDYDNKDLELTERMASLYAVAIQRDLAERELKNALEKEQELNELKSRFISMVSHEYRTPLSAIVLSTDLLTGYGAKMPPEEQLKHFRRILESVKTMNGLLDDIITFNKMDIGKIEVRPELLDFARFCSSISNSVQFLFKNKCRIDFRINEENMLLKVDEKLFRQIITNLLTNACKYSERDQIIDFHVEIGENRLQLVVADRGIGIPEDDKDKMFEPFHRARNVGTISGTGLGLSIVKNSVEAHGGVVEFESRQGEGTRFTITVPFEEKQRRNPKELPPAEQNHS